MAKERKFTIERGTDKIEVEVPQGWVHTDDIKETHVEKGTFQAEMDRRVKEVTKDLKKPEDLLNDDSFLKVVAEKKKDPLLKILNIDPSRTDVDVAKITSETTERVTREVVAPLQEQLAKRGEEADFLRHKTLDGQAVEAAHAYGAQPDLMPLIKLYVRENAAYDPTRREWFIKKLDGSEGYEFSTDPKKNGHPYMTVREFIEQAAKSGEKKSWFGAKTQPGPGFEGGPFGSTEMTLEQFQKLPPREQTAFYQKNPTQYTEFMDAIRRAGEEKLLSSRNLPGFGATR